MESEQTWEQTKPLPMQTLSPFMMLQEQPYNFLEVWIETVQIIRVGGHGALNPFEVPPDQMSWNSFVLIQYHNQDLVST